MRQPLEYRLPARLSLPLLLLGLLITVSQIAILTFGTMSVADTAWPLSFVVVMALTFSSDVVGPITWITEAQSAAKEQDSTLLAECLAAVRNESSIVSRVAVFQVMSVGVLLAAVGAGGAAALGIVPSTHTVAALVASVVWLSIVGGFRFRELRRDDSR